MENRARKKPLGYKILFCLLGALLLLLLIAVGGNLLSADYGDLSKADKSVLAELNALCSAQGENDPLWEDFPLGEKPILAINSGWGYGYLVNPAEAPRSIFAKKLRMPENSSLCVYRLSPLTPQLLSLRFSVGNFNTIGKTYRVLGSDVYFTKYSKKKSLEPRYSSAHYLTFLAHEAFHYYMQNDWAGGGRSLEELSDNDIELLAREYDVLALIQGELAKESPDPSLLKQYGQEYLALMEQRLNANPGYVNAELSMETAEGTAQYVGVRASRLAGYDYGILYFDNTKDVSFADVIPALKAGGIEKSFLSSRMPYETGALLCELLDALQVDGWQEKLNQQTLSSPVTLYALLLKALS